MRSRMAKQVQELRLQWSQESFWQEGQARGAVRVCKVMGLDQAGACEYLRALLPELRRRMRSGWFDITGGMILTVPLPRNELTIKSSTA